MADCLDQTITKRVGYEAQLANVGYAFESVEEMAVRVWISGYSQKLFEFAETFIEIMLECAKPGGFEHTQIMNSIEKEKSNYANRNLDCTEYATHNRLLFLLPHTFNDKRMAEILTEKLNNEDSIASSFDPGKMLKEKIVDEITAV